MMGMEYFVRITKYRERKGLYHGVHLSVTAFTIASWHQHLAERRHNTLSFLARDRLKYPGLSGVPTPNRSFSRRLLPGMSTDF